MYTYISFAFSFQAVVDSTAFVHAGLRDMYVYMYIHISICVCVDYRNYRLASNNT